MKIHCLLFLPILCFTSCATITRGVHEKLSVTSDPSGANVILSTGEKGVTPAVFVKERRTENFTVTVSKAGYLSQTVPVKSEFSATGGTALVAGGLLTLISPAVDATSGAYKSLYPNPVAVTLVSTSKSKSEKRSPTTSSERPPPPPKPKPSPTAKPPKPKPSPTPTRKL